MRPIHEVTGWVRNVRVPPLSFLYLGDPAVGCSIGSVIKVRVPYVAGVSEQIRMVCKAFNIRAVFNSGSTIRTKVKDPLPQQSTKYRAPAEKCTSEGLHGMYQRLHEHIRWGDYSMPAELLLVVKIRRARNVEYDIPDCLIATYRKLRVEPSQAVYTNSTAL